MSVVIGVGRGSYFSAGSKLTIELLHDTSIAICIKKHLVHGVAAGVDDEINCCGGACVEHESIGKKVRLLVAAVTGATLADVLATS